MLITEILKAKGDLVFTIAPDEKVSDAVALLHQRRVGALVVLDAHDKVVGIFSERDVVRTVAADGAAALSHSVEAVMTRDVIFAEQTETVDSLLSRMTDRRIRHLPVCEGERLIGLISIGDLVKSKIAESVAEAQSLKQYISAG
ncbi:CBS domain-containing protein [Caulobacter sp. S45]|jgi:CBS domain-containing protein|uniref:CBS domain-containing protein n=1 Tax=Caulobacter sp. S45 TaxID=1641861 RepID=UPI00131E6F6E|nr:CBS domain-containing protein [Caulobacter sp. S45]